MLLIAIILAGLASGCVKDPTDLPYALDDLVECHEKRDRSYDQLAERLVGEWQLVQEFCAQEGYTEDVPAEGYRLTLEENHDFAVMAHDSLLHAGEWQLFESFSGGIHTLNFTSQLVLVIPRLAGRIYLCDDLLVLSNSEKDFCDVYFERLN